tara:strand:+ start:3123 stop:4895 length:1773 start_codon:yes stop_codon:yes gene_type:complete
MTDTNRQLIEVKATGAQKAKRQLKGVSNGLKDMAKSAAMAAGAYFGARALLGAIKSSIDLFGQQELAEKKLEAALGKTSKELLNQAKALQQVTMFGDETVMEAQALIAAFVKDEEAIKAATEATLDLAAAKGFDLVASADLVSKTLGSSTNALSRYGIQVEGAVGSTERLESLTGSIADIFGGQAKEQTDTMAGALAQMKNAIGDAGESFGEILSPAVTSVAGFLKEAAENASNFFRELTETDLETTIRELENLGVEGESLLRLKNLQLDRDIKILNKELKDVNKTGLDAQAIEDRLVEISKERKKLGEEIGAIELGMTDERRKSLELEKIQIEQGNMTVGLAGDANYMLHVHNEMQERKKQINDELGISQEGQLDNLSTEEEALLNISVILAKINGLELQRTKLITGQTDATKDGEDATTESQKKQKKLLEEGAKAQKKLINSLQDSAEAKKLEDYKEAFRAAAASAVKAYKWGVERGGPVVGAIAGATAFAAATALANQVTKFATGGDFVTDGPQMIMVGDNPSGKEHVQITPLADDPNVSGPQNGNITINLNNPMMTEDMVESEIIPRIREGIRLGNNLGQDEWGQI